MPRSDATRRRQHIIEKMAKGEPITRRDLDLQKALDEIDLSARVFKRPRRRTSEAYALSDIDVTS